MSSPQWSKMGWSKPYNHDGNSMNLKAICMSLQAREVSALVGVVWML